MDHLKPCQTAKSGMNIPRNSTHIRAQAALRAAALPPPKQPTAAGGTNISAGRLSDGGERAMSCRDAAKAATERVRHVASRGKLNMRQGNCAVLGVEREPMQNNLAFSFFLC